jgi:hypothetical protein
MKRPTRGVTKRSLQRAMNGRLSATKGAIKGAIPAAMSGGIRGRKNRLPDTVGGGTCQIANHSPPLATNGPMLGDPSIRPQNATGPPLW